MAIQLIQLGHDYLLETKKVSKICDMCDSWLETYSLNSILHDNVGVQIWEHKLRPPASKSPSGNASMASLLIYLSWPFDVLSRYTTDCKFGQQKVADCPWACQGLHIGIIAATSLAMEEQVRVPSIDSTAACCEHGTAALVVLVSWCVWVGVEYILLIWTVHILTVL